MDVNEVEGTLEDLLEDMHIIFIFGFSGYCQFKSTGKLSFRNEKCLKAQWAGTKESKSEMALTYDGSTWFMHDVPDFLHIKLCSWRLVHYADGSTRQAVSEGSFPCSYSCYT